MLNHEIHGNLAKLLAVENIIVEHKPTQTASFDVVDRVLTLPLWDKASEDVYQMLILHEVGHAKYTPTDSWVEHFEKYGDVLNVLEDFRIERLIKVKYPGSRKTFHTAYKELFESDFFKIKNIDTYNLIDRINLYFKVGTHIQIKFNEDEKVIINRIENASTFEDILNICKDLLDYVLESKKSSNSEDSEGNSDLNQDQKSAESNSNSENLEENFNSNQEQKSAESNSNSNSNSEDSEGNSDSIRQNTQNSNQSNSSDDLKTQTGGSTSKPNGTPGSKKLSDLTDDLKSETNKNFNDSVKTLSNLYTESIQYVEIPKIYIDRIIIPNQEIHDKINKFLNNNSRDLYNKFKTQCKREVSYLVKEFQCKKAADIFMRAKENKTGVLDCKKIFSYKYNENIFKSVITLPEGVNHGLIFFLDWSGSMDRIMKDTYKQLCSLIWFCRKLNIPFDVYAFTNGYNDGYDKIKYKKENNKFEIDDFSLMNLISTKNKKINVETQMFNIFKLIHNRSYGRIPGFSLGGTPLDVTLMSIKYIIPRFMESTKVQKLQCIILTDGEGNDVKVVKSGNSYNPIVTEGFIRDRKLKTTYKISGSSSRSYLTNAILKNLSDEFTYCNFIGIRLIPNSYEFNSFLSYQCDYNTKEYKDYKNQWEKNESVSITTSGYSRYFGIKSSSISMDSEFRFEDKTESGIRREFKNRLIKRKTNKKILSEFIDIIS